MRISVVALDGVFDLGLSAVLDAFQTANELIELSDTAVPRFDVRIVGVRKKVTTSQGLGVPVHAPGTRAPDCLVVPAIGFKMPAPLEAAVKRRLVSEGITGILVTHDQQEALSFADQLVVLEEGRVVQAGSPRELYLQPRTEMLARFLGDTLMLDAIVAGGEADTPLGRVRVARAIDEIAFGVLTAAQAGHLALSAGHPCALVTRSAYDLAGRCVEVRHTRGDAHAFHYTVTIT